MRDQTPEPPRDLWARTAAAIEAEAAGHGSDETGPVRQRLPIGVISGLAVVALVVGVSVLSGTILLYDDTGNGVKGEDGVELPPGSSVAARPAGVEPTPFAVDAGAVGWIDQGPNAGVHTAVVDRVCPVKGAAGCPTLETESERSMAFKAATKTIVGSPTRRQAVAIAKSTADGDEVVVVALPGPAETPAPSQQPPAETPEPATPSASPVSASAAASASAAPGEHHSRCVRAAAGQPAAEPHADDRIERCDRERHRGRRRVGSVFPGRLVVRLHCPTSRRGGRGRRVRLARR